MDVTLLEVFAQYGALGLLAVGMFWLVQHIYGRMEKVIERNTQAFNELNRSFGELRNTLQEHNRRFETLLEYVIQEVKKR